MAANTKRPTILDLYAKKEKGEKATWITAYNFSQATAAQNAGIDMILVGDSLGMVELGLSGTIPVTMDQCIHHCKAVRRGAPYVFVIGDMPFLSYQTSDSDAVYNAGRFCKEAEVDAIKLEGGIRVASQIKAITDSGVCVFGHIGLTPQSSGIMGGFKAQGRNIESARKIIDDALAVEEAGAMVLLVEGVPTQVTEIITKVVKIPVYGIGAGPACDGQVIVIGDAMGFIEGGFTPKFAKRYTEVGAIMTKAMEQYADEVKKGIFPGPEYCYKAQASDEEFAALLKEYQHK